MEVLTIIRNEFSRSLKYKKRMIVGFILPIIAIIASFGINGMMKPSINIGIINESKSESFTYFYENSKTIKGLIVKNANSSSMITDMILGKYNCIIEVSDENYKVSSLDNTLKENMEELIDGFFISGNLDGFQVLLDNVRGQDISVAERGIGLIFMVLLITCTMNASNILKDRKEGILLRIMISPLKVDRYFFGTYLYSLLNTIVQMTISTIVISLLPINIGISFFDLLLILILLAFIATSIAQLIVSFSKNELQSSITATVLSMIMALFGGIFLAINKMPALIKMLSNGSIIKWIVELVNNIVNKNINLQILFPVLIIVFICFFLLIISSIIYRKKLYYSSC